MRDHPDSRRIVTLTGRLAAQHGHVRQLADAMVKYLRRLTPQERVIAIEAILYERRAHYAALYAHHFGVDLAADPPALVAGFRGPLRDTEDGLCSALALLFTIHDLAYAGLVSTRHEPVAQRARIALAHYLAAFLLAPLMDAQIVARESPSAMERESATYSVAGWVRSRISLSHDPDLRRAAHEYNSAATIDYALIEALPAAVLTALDAERDEAWDCDRFFRRALAELRRRAPRKTQSRTDPTTGETVRR